MAEGHQGGDVLARIDVVPDDADRRQVLDMLAAGRRELADGRTDLHHSLDVAQVAMWKADIDTGECMWSPNAHQVLGLDLAVPIDTIDGFFELVAPEDVTALRDIVQDLQVDTGTMPEEWEFRVIDGAGRRRWMYGRGQRVPDPGNITLRGVMFDITERRQLQEQVRDQEQMLSGLISASPDGIVVSGLDGEIRFASDGIFDVIGMRPEELVDRHTWEFIDPELHVSLTESTRRLRTDPQGIEQMRLLLLHSRGHVVTVDCRMRLLTDAHGDADGFVIVVRDVSDQARLEVELAHARDEAEAANRAKSDYLARMSHELRTPMNSVLGFAQLLELSELSPSDRDSVDRILGAGRHLMQLIDDVLDIARVEAGQFTISLARVPLRDVVTAATDLLRPQMTDAGLQLYVDVCERMRVMADRKRLSQVLINLLSNAVKYNRPGGQITVSCSQTEQGWCRLAVTDTGAGIAAGRLPLLFGAFERLGADRTDVPGTGLGLALSRTLVDAMGGRIGCDSILGEGSTFWLDLPITAPEDDSPAGDLPITTPTADAVMASTARRN